MISIPCRLLPAGDGRPPAPGKQGAGAAEVYKRAGAKWSRLGVCVENTATLGYLGRTTLRAMVAASDEPDVPLGTGSSRPKKASRAGSGIGLVAVDADLTLTGVAYDALKKAIMAMNIYDTDTDLRLDERALAADLGISRTPVREALVRLEQEGLVRTVPRRGVYVVRKSKSEIIDIIIASAALEAMAARLVVERASDEELAELQSDCSRSHKDAGRMSVARYSELNLRFHQRLLDLSQSPTIIEMVGVLQVHMRAIRGRTMADADRQERSIAEHCEMVDAIMRRDADAAERHVRDHALHLARHVADNVSYLD